MKVMKKYILSLLAVVAVVSCTTFKEEAPKKAVVPGNPNIEINEVGDTGFTFTITVAPGTGFFTYAVMTGEPKELDSVTLFKQGYKSSSIVTGTVDYTKTGSPLVVKMTDLSYTTKYSVYAVAASAEDDETHTGGTLSAVVTNWCTTTDTEKPAITGYTRKGNVLTLSFSEPVVYNSEIRATATYYAVNAAVIEEGELVKTGEQGKGEVAVACSGKSATLTVTLDGTNPLPDGAYYTVGYGPGMFKDASGNNIAGIDELVGVTSTGTLGFGNLYGHIDNAEFDIVPEVSLVTPFDENIVVPMPEDVEFFCFTEDAKATLTREIVDDNKTITVVYDIDFAYDEETANLVFLFPDDIELESGDTFTVDLAGGSVEDIYSNVNTAMSQEYLYSFGYTIDDIAGTYLNSGKSGYGAAYNEPAWTFSIAESDDPSKGNVMVTSYYNIETKIYADFDYDTGIFTMPYDFEFINGTIEENVEVEEGVFADVYTAWFATGYYSGLSQEPTGDPLQLMMGESGVFTDANDYVGYYYERYVIPEGGVEAITDDDFLDYDYNIFIPTPMSKVLLGAPAKSVAKNCVEMPVVEKVAIKRIAK